MSEPVRPRLHVTAPVGWLNDPHGLCWVGDRYHLFYQAQPEATVWSPGIGWGHAIGRDLLDWTPLPLALAPQGEETGCWTGDVRLEGGQPVVYYTSATVDRPALARVARAVPDEPLRHWTVASIVVDGPPDGLGAHSFRDPCLVDSPAGPRMVVGTGVDGGVALAAHYAEEDGRWRYLGPLCARASEDVAGAWTGSMWECPRLFPVGDDWVLLVSVWTDDTLHYVAAAVGSYDGTAFVPRRWSRLTHDDYAYATTSAADRHGRPTVMSWLRERDDHDPADRPWAGALSLPALLTIGADDTLRLDPHPDVAARRTAAVPCPPDGPTVVDDAAGLDVELPADDSAPWRFLLHRGPTAAFALTWDGADLTVAVPGRETWTLPVAADTVRVVVDIGIVEMFAGAGSGAARISESAGLALELSGPGSDRARVYRLTV